MHLADAPARTDRVHVTSHHMLRTRAQTPAPEMFASGDRDVCKRISYCLHMAYHTMSRVDRSRTPPRDFFSLAGALIVPKRLIKTFNSDCGGDLWPGLMYDILISHEDKEYWAYKDFRWRFI